MDQKRGKPINIQLMNPSVQAKAAVNYQEAGNKTLMYATGDNLQIRSKVPSKLLKELHPYKQPNLQLMNPQGYGEIASGMEQSGKLFASSFALANNNVELLEDIWRVRRPNASLTDTIDRVLSRPGASSRIKQAPPPEMQGLEPVIVPGVNGDTGNVLYPSNEENRRRQFMRIPGASVAQDLAAIGRAIGSGGIASVAQNNNVPAINPGRFNFLLNHPAASAPSMSQLNAPQQRNGGSNLPGMPSGLPHQPVPQDLSDVSYMGGSNMLPPPAPPQAAASAEARAPEPSTPTYDSMSVLSPDRVVNLNEGSDSPTFPAIQALSAQQSHGIVSPPLPSRQHVPAQRNLGGMFQSVPIERKETEDEERHRLLQELAHGGDNNEDMEVPYSEGTGGGAAASRDSIGSQSGEATSQGAFASPQRHTGSLHDRVRKDFEDFVRSRYTPQAPSYPVGGDTLLPHTDEEAETAHILSSELPFGGVVSPEFHGRAIPEMTEEQSEHIHSVYRRPTGKRAREGADKQMARQVREAREAGDVKRRQEEEEEHEHKQTGGSVRERRVNHAFGTNMVIDLNKLKNGNEVSVRYSNNLWNPNLPAQKVSNQLKNVIVKVLQKQPYSLSKLSKEEGEYLKRLLHYTKIQKQSNDWLLKNNFNRYLGEIEAGNNNKKLKTQLGGVIEKMRKRKILSPADLDWVHDMAR